MYNYKNLLEVQNLIIAVKTDILKGMKEKYIFIINLLFNSYNNSKKMLMIQIGITKSVQVPKMLLMVQS